MLRVLMVLAALAAGALAAERQFDFSQAPVNQAPKGFRSAVTGAGAPGDWQVILDDAPAAMPGASAPVGVVTKQAVLAQLARDKTDEHYPLLIFEGDTYGDFTLTTRLKTVSGDAERMAGVAFRVQNEKNYYYVRISSLGNNIRFFKFVEGALNPVPIGKDLPVPAGVWHELKVECRGSQIRVWLNGQEAMPTLNDPSFATGRIGFWTKSDSVSYFADARLSYTRLVRFADSLVRDTLKKYGKLHALRLFAIPRGQSKPRVLASGTPAEVGEPGGPEAQDCLQHGTAYVGKDKEKDPGSITVLLPLRDRNGDIVAAAKVSLPTFLGQTQENALARTRPIIRFMEGRMVASPETLQ